MAKRRPFNRRAPWTPAQAASVLNTWPTWWGNALYAARVRRGIPRHDAKRDTDADAERWADDTQVSVTFNGEQRECPRTIALQLVSLGADITMVTRQHDLGLG